MLSVSTPLTLFNLVLSFQQFGAETFCGRSVITTSSIVAPSIGLMTTQSSSFCYTGFVKFATLSDADALFEELDTTIFETRDTFVVFFFVVFLPFAILLAEG